MEEWYLWYMYTYGMHTYNLLTIDTQNRKANLHPHCEAVKEDNFWSKNGQFKYIVCTISYIHYSAAGNTRRRCLEAFKAFLKVRGSLHGLFLIRGRRRLTYIGSTYIIVPILNYYHGLMVMSLDCHPSGPGSPSSFIFQILF